MCAHLQGSIQADVLKAKRQMKISSILFHVDEKKTWKKFHFVIENNSQLKQTMSLVGIPIKHQIFYDLVSIQCFFLVIAEKVHKIKGKGFFHCLLSSVQKNQSCRNTLATD